VELRQLEYFVAVAEERHFTRAARRVRVAQSGLSASIRALERDLGAPLFIRNTRRVELTDSGRAFLAEARHVLSTADAAREAVASVNGLLRGTLAVGTLQCLGGIDLIGTLAAYHRRYPGVEIELRQGGSVDLIDRVRAGGLDVAFVSEPVDGAPGVAFEPLLSQPMVLACSAEHPFAGRTGVPLIELTGEKFVDFPAGWVTRDVTDRALPGRRVSLEANDVHTLLDLVGHGMGIALVPQDFAHKPTTATFVPLAEPTPLWRTAVATAVARHPSAAAKALLAMID
jgi:DNA-binding transcriptional LysR family regulator